MPDRDDPPVLTPELLLRAYAAGIFPMAESADAGELRWFDPPRRGIVPLDTGFHVQRRLRRTIRRQPYRVACDTAFRAVVQACAAPAPGRTTTWINREIVELYCALHRSGHAHSIEAWENNELVGGLYGVSLGAAFFGESMFSRKTDASKIALVYLVSLLRHSGFTLLDAQYQTEHLRQFGAVEISRNAYRGLLFDALAKAAQIAAPVGGAWDLMTQAMLAEMPGG